MNAGAAIALGALGALTIVVIRWTGDDYERLGRLSEGASLAAWALYTMHTAAVALAAIEGIWRLGVPHALATALGGALAVPGAALALSAALRFHSWTQLTGRSNERLVTEGVYRFSRHPQNVGWGILLAGAAFASRSALAMLLALAFWAAFLVYARVEERHLLRVYGKPYERYRARTPRLLGASRS